MLRRLSRKRGIELWIGALQRAEVLFLLRPREVEPTMLLLSRFETAPVTRAVVDLAGELYRRWHPSHGTGIHDAMLAATALETGGKIYTLNVKHYPMPDLVVVRGW
jgi:hypothetical protein